jgi:hypothetical protein
VFEGLEGADRHPELLSLARILHRQLDESISGADQLGRAGERASIERQIEERARGLPLGHQAVRRCRPLDAVEALPGIVRGLAHEPHVGGRQRVQPVLSSEQQQVRDVRIAHEGAHGMTHGDDRLAARDRLQPATGDLGIGKLGEQRRRDGGRGDDRLRERGTADLFTEQHDVDLVEAHALVLLGHAHAGQPHLRQLRPELPRPTRLVLP